MLRTLLVGILAVTAAAACSSKGDAPALQPGVSAGKVLELTGTVTATRGTEVRTLAAGGEISSDDVIDTAAGSRVVILVAHNNARWDLGPNKHGKVGESLAWTAAKQDRPVTAVIEESSTAGAHAEKTAATTGTTTAEAPRTAMAEQAAKPSSDKAAAAPAVVQGTAAPVTAATPPSIETTTPPSPPLRTEPPRRKATPHPTPATTTTPPPLRSVREEAADQKATAPANITGAKLPVPDGSGGAGMTVPGGEGGAKGSADAPVREQIRQGIREQFAKGRVEMRACFEPTVANVLIRIAVTNGVYTIAIVDRAATPKARACLASIAKRLGTTTKHDEPVYVKLTLKRL